MTDEAQTEAARWGGFFRRAFALLIDLAALAPLCLLLFYLVYVAYRVGLAAHRQRLGLEHLEMLSIVALAAWVFLIGGYFVLFHAMGGKTIGKWVMGLKVVDAGREPITAARALVRWLGMFVSALAGLGFLWVLWSREKRAWHDLLAGTWVIRG